MVSEELLAYQLLELRVPDYAKQLATLLEVSSKMASTLELEPLLGLILDQLKRVVGYTDATILDLEGEELAGLAYRSPLPQEQMLQVRFPLEKAPAHRQVLVSKGPCIISDLLGDAPPALLFRESDGERPERNIGSGRSWMGIPLIVRDRTIGMLSLYHDETDYYSPRKAQLALAVAGYAAAAIENARLYQEERERRREAERRHRAAEGVRDILAAINSDRPPNEILEHVVTQAGSLLDSGTVVLYRRQTRVEPLTIQAGWGLPGDPAEMVEFPLGPRITGRAALGRRPVVVSDVAEMAPDVAGAPGPRPILSGVCRAMLAVPILIKREAYGAIELYYREPREFSEEEVRLAVSLADQAALAIENARLRAQAEEVAVAAERTRLARDLHDAVTQTLFSASLIAEVLPRLWKRSPREGRRRLEELRQLTRGALAEMRTMLLELRPTALTEVDLGDLLRQLADAMTGRARLRVAVEVEGNRTLPPDIQVAFYRIAQEALNNVAKHAEAALASVELRFLAEGVELSIIDDGRGFDPEDVSAEHLGLEIMDERAESIGAVLKIDSRPGHGTRVVVRWSERGE